MSAEEGSGDRRVVLFGAGGYTGRETAHRLCELGARPLLVGRSPGPLESLADDLGASTPRWPTPSGPRA